MKKYIILLLLILLVGLSFIGIKLLNQKPKSNIETGKHSYICTIQSEWQKFSSTNKDINGFELGKYKKINEFSFDIINGKHLSNTLYLIKFEFENIDGYSYMNIEGEYKKEFDEQKLIKKFLSDKIIPEQFTEDNIEKYLEELSQKGYTCIKK